MHGPGFGGIGRETSQVFDDARMSGILNAAGNSNDFLGLNIRSQAIGTSTYAARIEFSTGRMAVFKIVNFAAAFTIFSDSPEQGSQPLLSDLDRSYFVQFDVIGNVLDARAYDQPGGSELLHVHYVDDQGLGGPPLPPGFAGVSAIREEGSLDGAFDNLSVTAIPEPGSCVLAVVGLAILASFRRSNWESGRNPEQLRCPMSDADLTNVSHLMFDGHGSGSALPSAEPLSPAVPEPISNLTQMLFQQGK